MCLIIIVNAKNTIFFYHRHFYQQPMIASNDFDINFDWSIFILYFILIYIINAHWYISHYVITKLIYYKIYYPYIYISIIEIHILNSSNLLSFLRTLFNPNKLRFVRMFVYFFTFISFFNGNTANQSFNYAISSI